MAVVIPNEFVVGFETVAGTTQADPVLYPLCIQDMGITASNDTEMINCIGERDAGGDNAITGTTIEGDIGALARWEQIPIYFKGLLGNPVSVDNLDGTFSHTFVSDDNALPSMFIETVLSNGVTQMFNNVKFGKIATEFQGKGLPKITTSTVASKQVDSIVDGHTTIGRVNAVTLADTPLNNRYSYIKINATDACKVSMFSLNIDTGLETVDLIDKNGTSCTGKSIHATKTEVSGSLEAIFDETIYAQMKNNTKVSVEVGYEQGDYKLSVTMPEVQFSFKTEPLAVNQRVPVKTDFTVSRSGVPPKATIVIKNTTATYA